MSAVKEIWILGATGRVGRSTAEKLLKKQFHVVLVGRDQSRLDALVEKIKAEGGDSTVKSNIRTIELQSIEAIINELKTTTTPPAVLVNTIGPFSRTGLPLIQACPPGTHYVDISNEFPAARDVFSQADEAKKTNRCLVTGVGFGVLATESIVLKLCEGRPVPETVRTAALAMVDEENTGRVGEVLAATITEVITTGGGRYADGVFVKDTVGAHLEMLTLPGEDSNFTVHSSAGACGELEAAFQASKAPNVIATSKFGPSNALGRMAVPVLSSLLGFTSIRNFVERQIANVTVKKSDKPRQKYSYGHARVHWADGTIREGWLRTGDGLEFTCEVTAQVAARLCEGRGKPGSYTPGCLFGADLALDCGGAFIDIVEKKNQI